MINDMAKEDAYLEINKENFPKLGCDGMLGNCIEACFGMFMLYIIQLLFHTKYLSKQFTHAGNLLSIPKLLFTIGCSMLCGTKIT